MAQTSLDNLLLKAPLGLALAMALVVTSCLPAGRGGGSDDASSCSENSDCNESEEYCKADDPSVSTDGSCIPLVAAGGVCLLGSDCDSDLFCLVDNGLGEGECSVAPSSCLDGPSCSCDPMLAMCAPGGNSCADSADSVTLYCNNGPAGGLGDDDDDDATAPGDDDTGDDDDSVGGANFTAMTFSAELTATSGVGGAVGVAATYTIHYWLVYDSATATYEPECNQLISVEGVATFGSAASTGCSDCTGKIDFDASTAVDISPSAPAGQGCDVAVLDAAGRNMGQALLLSQANGGWGDFLSIGLIDATTMGNEGLDLLAGGGATAADLDVGLADQGRVFTHAGYSDMQTGNLADLASIDITFAPAGSGSSWHGAWQISTDPSQNTYVGPDLNGQYSVAGIWLITFEPSE